jgi:hypothetical protein
MSFYLIDFEEVDKILFIKALSWGWRIPLGWQRNTNPRLMYIYSPAKKFWLNGLNINNVIVAHNGSLSLRPSAESTLSIRNIIEDLGKGTSL